MESKITEREKRLIELHNIRERILSSIADFNKANYQFQKDYKLPEQNGFQLFSKPLSQVL